MSSKVTRRQFLKKSAVAATAVSGLVAAGRDTEVRAQPAKAEVSSPKANAGLLLGGRVALSQPVLASCQLAFRIGLARQRTASYPCDSLDFIMLDLERPEGRSRHAHWCTGDLTGRLLEFLSCTEGIDGKSDPRLKGLFERVLSQRRPSGLFGKLPDKPDGDGFVHFPPVPLPEWSYFDEGPGSQTWVEGAAASVPLKFPSGEIKTLRFTPLCYNTSNLTLCETPLVFSAVES
ncbi:MAG: twin-arginine translocation signal domain-containing protein [Planctomycetota bacterium]|nr:twin-arginine translocation signal domain-containing protein [Planctomycetota bacterium]